LVNLFGEFAPRTGFSLAANVLVLVLVLLLVVVAISSLWQREKEGIVVLQFRGTRVY